MLDLGSGPRATATVDSRRILVADPAGGEYVVWDNTKYPLTASSTLAALGLGNQEPVTAPAAWLAALRTGPALAPAVVRDAGQPGPSVAGRAAAIGELFESTGAGVSQYYVLLAGTDYQPGSTALCVRQRSPGTAGSAAVVTENLGGSGVSVPAGAGASAPGGAGATLPPSVDIIVPPGAGMIAQAPSAAPGPAPPQSYLITDTGVKYPLADGSAVAALGYGGVTARLMPAAILDLIPTGPALSAAAARKTVT